MIYADMTPEEFERLMRVGYERAKAKHDAMVRAGFVLRRSDGSDTSGPAYWVKEEV